MKTLERFWQWADTEKPTPDVAVSRISNLSDDALRAMHQASALILQRAIPSADWSRAGATHAALELCSRALRDLSLALCEPLTRMRAAVPVSEMPKLGAFPGVVNGDGLELLKQAAEQVQLATAISQQHAQPPECAAIQRVNDQLMNVDRGFRREYMGNWAGLGHVPLEDWLPSIPADSPNRGDRRLTGVVIGSRRAAELRTGVPVADLRNKGL